MPIIPFLLLYACAEVPSDSPVNSAACSNPSYVIMKYILNHSMKYHFYPIKIRNISCCMSTRSMYATLYHNTPSYNVSYHTALCYILHYTLLFYTIPYSTIQYSTILYYAVLYYTILYYTIILLNRI